MDFRSRLLGGLVLLALITTGTQTTLGYLGFQRSLQNDLNGDLLRLSDTLKVAIELEHDSDDAALHFEVLEHQPDVQEMEGRWQVIRGHQVLASSFQPFPKDRSGWLIKEEALDAQMTLQVALNVTEHNQALQEYLKSSLTTLGFSVVFAVVMALLLLRYLLLPLSRLQHAIGELARSHYPSPLQAEGHDALGELTRSFNQMVSQLRQAADRERSFTRYASHELRTPLTAIKANLGAVQAGVMPEQEFLEVVSSNTRHMESILQGLLHLARGTGEPTPFDLKQLVQEQMGSFSPEQQARFHLHPDSPEPLEVNLPRVALGNAIRNLLDNALKYSSGPVDVHLQARTLQVRDHGQGVPEAMLGKLTGAFFRASADIEGSGLGLAYVQQVAEAIDGTLVFRNLPEGGFEVQLSW